MSEVCMKSYVLFLPIIFIIHDMEEIVGFENFFKKNPEVFENFPRITSAYKNFKTDAFALAVYEEFIPFFGVAILAYFFQGKILNAIWFGLMLSLTAHFLIHIAQSIYIRKYIPSLITSLLLLPASVFILAKTHVFLQFDFLTLILIALSILGMMANLKLAHSLMKRAGGME